MRLRPRVYIAGPMSQGDRVANLNAALVAYRELLRLGYAPLCPQLSFFVDGLFGFSWAEWLGSDLPWVAASNMVLRLPGESRGADHETRLAGLLGIPIFGSVEDLVSAWPIIRE